MSNISKTKSKNLMPHLNIKPQKKEKIEVPHPTNNNKLKVYKTNRPFGQDITNNIKPNYPLIPMGSFHKNKLNKVDMLSKASAPGKNKTNSSKKKSSSKQKISQELSKMSTTNTKKTNKINSNSIMKEQKNRVVKDQFSDMLKNKTKSSSMQRKIQSTKSEINSNLKTKSFLYGINYYNNSINQIKNNNKIKPTNEELINRLKNKTSALKFSITSKNYYMNLKSKGINNQNINSFQLEEEPFSKNVKRSMGNQDFTKGINILGKIDTFKDKNKFNKTGYSNYLNDLRNTRSFDIKNYNNNNNNEKLKEKSINGYKIISDASKADKNKINNLNNKENYNLANIKANNAEKNMNDKVLKEIKTKKSIEDNEKLKNMKIIEKNKIEKNNNEENNNELKLRENDSKKKVVEKSNKSITKDNNSQINKEKDKTKEPISTKENINPNTNQQEPNIKKEKSDYASPVKKPKNKKNDKNKISHSKNPNAVPIVIQYKPISPKNSSNIKNKTNDEEDLKTKYFDSSLINNIKDIQIPKEYLNIIYYNLLKEEKANMNLFKPEYNYMKNQKEINEEMRSILTDWIIDVHGKFGFTDETLYMTILIIDRYSSLKTITRNEYQCLGISALMIACKHEEINVPKVEDFIYITDNAYNKDEVFKMEEDILGRLKYNLMYPSPIKFFEYLSLNFGFDKKKHYLGKYLMETFLVNLNWIKFKPSIIGCAAAYIVMKFFKMKNYKDSYLKKWYMIEDKPGYEVENGCGVKDCAQEMCNFIDNINSTNYLSCQKKYTGEKYCNIAKLILSKNENVKKTE